MGKFVEGLLESVQQRDEIRRGEPQPSRAFTLDALQVRKVCTATGLIQAKFAAIIDVRLGSLRNREQGRREPGGPVRALLRAIHNDPKHAILALSA
ncbi:transcriptional regulator [Pseudomonas sp. AOB-7]|uniref:helix-turn-helix domain-containing protein n=1 Tax=Pseudomonas sp. AOB-7 TaxID=2482750 RepID=UPI000EFAA3AD|nr:transcriptional regulator [Pseudomonas sp. AOB-7]RMH82613.1 transcriptional regulator [Pseudomonas sp. AOB-7]